MHRKLLTLLFLSVLFATLLQAQVTTSTLTGTVKDQSGQPLAGATVSATNLSTGRVYQVTTNRNGGYNIFNMIPGGPYRIAVSYTGYETQTRDDITLSLGEAPSQDFVLTTRNEALSEVVVTAARTTPNRLGSETTIGRDKIANLPTVGRNLSDLLRFTPQARITNGGGIAIAGQNNRFNTFMIDGAVNNDVFGLSESGTNGGRAGAPPISLDAIDQISVQVSPFDVSLGNFTGGGINAITKSGSNKFAGSVYYVFRNEDLAGRSPIPVIVGGKETRPKFSDFSNKTYGFRIGGPIIQNKLFFFLNAEKQDDTRPQPFDAGSYRGEALRNDSLNILINYLKNNYNYDPGEYINNPDIIQGTRIASRIDYNLSDKHQLMASYRYTNLERTNPSRSSANSINFVSGGEFFPSVQHSGTAELNSRFTNTINNKFRVSYTNVVDNRDPVGTPFPAVAIRDASGTINIGSDISSSANLLEQDILNLYDAFKYNMGRHIVTAGFDIDFNKTYNQFIQSNFGNYEYPTIGAFIKNEFATRYRRGYSLVSAKSGDESEGTAAEFRTHRLGFFLGDDFKITPNLTLTFGLRTDRTVFDDQPATDVFFRDSAAQIISQYYDLRGAQTGRMYDPSWQWSPRLGFRATLPDENITVRGGVGLFAGRIPLVWPGGVFQNTGVTAGGIDINRTGSQPNIFLSNGQPLRFRPDINNQYTGTDFGLSGTRTFPQGSLNLISKDFKMPQVLRTSLGFDKRLANGWTFNIEGIFTKNIVEVDWFNYVLDPTKIVQTTGPGVRNVYDPRLTPFDARKIPLRPNLGVNLRNPYTNIILITNNEDRKGYAYNFTAGIDKAFRQGWALNANYTYGSSVVKNEATSSINASNWNNMEAVNGRNYIGLTTSDFDLGHRVYTYVSKTFNYFRNRLSTTITLDYTGQSGSPYSYTMTGNINGDNVNFNDLMYIPTAAEVQQMTFQTNTTGGVTYTADQQKALFEEYIQGDRYLRKHRGEFAGRNEARLPFVNVFTLKLQQDYNLKVGANTYKLQVIYDMFNVANFLNKDWGRQYFANFDQVQILQFTGFRSGTTIPQYRFTPVSSGRAYSISDGVNNFNTSRWSGQLTFRVTF